MKNKILVLSIILIGVASVIFFMKDSSSIKNKIVKKVTNSKTHYKNVNNDNEEKIKSLDDIKKVIRNKEEKKVFPKAYSILKDQLVCIKDETCTQNKNDRFYDPKIDPANIIVRRSLEVLNEITLLDHTKLEDVSDDVLLEVIKIKNTSSVFLAYNLLLRKGLPSFLKTKKLAYGFEGEMAFKYIQIFKNQTLAQTPATQKIRDELILFYIDEKDAATGDLVLEEVQKHKLNKSFVSQIVELGCNKYSPFEGESANARKLKLENLARSINKKLDC